MIGALSNKATRSGKCFLYRCDRSEAVNMRIVYAYCSILFSPPRLSSILLPQPLHSDIIHLKDNICVILDQGKDAFTRTLPPVVAGVIGILHLFTLGGTIIAANHIIRVFIMQ